MLESDKSCKIIVFRLSYTVYVCEYTPRHFWVYECISCMTVKVFLGGSHNIDSCMSRCMYQYIITEKIVCSFLHSIVWIFPYICSGCWHPFETNPFWLGFLKPPYSYFQNFLLYCKLYVLHLFGLMSFYSTCTNYLLLQFLCKKPFFFIKQYPDTRTNYHSVFTRIIDMQRDWFLCKFTRYTLTRKQLWM